MGKSDKQQLHLTFDTKRATRPVQEESPEAAHEEHTRRSVAPESTLLAMQQSLQFIDNNTDSLNLCMDQMATKLDHHGTVITEDKEVLSVTEYTLHSMRDASLNMEKVIALIQAKNEVLEARSHKNNICILGIPESTNTGKMELYVMQLLRDVFW
ncbi:hypothetical protein NDU88_000220 [Pleurodeles waltl]|uniref:Uncharacterized protein n=1 Tax=Pleurodeles waltl TaxID=8319 RepID=A0AAV7S7I7_PLEWA|nr:hypothetical protein NDU88_000220 [Pleurodeles waltl]